MRRLLDWALPMGCLLALIAACFGSVLVGGQQFAYRDSAHYYYPLYQQVQAEWDAGRVPLWSTQENGGMPLLGNPTAAVLYPGKVLYAALPYPWAARLYVVAHVLLAFSGTLALMRSWDVGWTGSALSGLSFAFGMPILFQYCNIIFLVGASWMPLGFRAVDRWLRLGRRSGLIELAVVLAMQVLGGDPQVAYLTGLCAGGYAIGLSWSRNPSGSSPPDRSRRGLGVTLAVGVVAWVGVTLAMAAWLPDLRPTGTPESSWSGMATALHTIWARITGPPSMVPSPKVSSPAAAVAGRGARPGTASQTPPLPWMTLAPRVISVCWGVVGLLGLMRWRRRKGSVLGPMLVGLAGSALLAGMLAGAQLLPVLEYTGQTGRAAQEGPHDIYPFSLDPIRLAEFVWPSVFGMSFHENRNWLMALPPTYGRAKAWVPSLYLGGLTILLALGAMGFRGGPPWRSWLTAIAVVTLLAALGEYTSPIYWARFVPACARAIGPHDPVDVASIRIDGYLRDGDGGVYWFLATVLPGFRQFRYPSKLLSFTVLALAALAGIGWERVISGQSRRPAYLASGLLVITLASLAIASTSRGRILEIFQAANRPATASGFGPMDPAGAFAEMRRSLAQTAIVMALGLALALRGSRHVRLAGAVALIAVTADLGFSNARYVLTAPQALFETVPKVVQLIRAAERDHPTSGPYRVHRMPIWNPIAWHQESSVDRVRDFLVWERDTLQPKYGLPYDVQYTMTLGVAELYDYEFFFGAFYRTVDDATAREMKLPPGNKMVYHPRRSYDLWNTRYFVLPVHPAGWVDEHRGYASFLPETEAIYPRSDAFDGPKGQESRRQWVEREDFQVLRNKAAYPRAWIVHRARYVNRIDGLGRKERQGPMEEMVYQDDAFWKDPTRHVYDPTQIAWVEADDAADLAAFLRTNRGPKDSATITTYEPQRVVLDVTLDDPGLVILADVYYPGWRLTIDGRPAPIYRTNRLMRGAAVTSGKHRLVYTYHPRSFRVGSWITMAGLVALSVLGVGCWRHPVSSRSGPPRALMANHPGGPLARDDRVID